MYHYWMSYRGGICNKNISIRVRWMFYEIYMLILCEALTIFTKVDFLCCITIQHTNCIQTIMGAYDTRFDDRQKQHIYNIQKMSDTEALGIVEMRDK